MQILVVDDFGPFRQFICSMLREQPELRIVGEAADGFEAVQKAQELQPDLILLDIGLPKLDGIAAAGRIRRLAPTAKIIFVSQNSDKEIVREALSDGARGYVLKADVGRELVPAVNAVLRGEKFVSRQFTDSGAVCSLGHFASSAGLHPGPRTATCDRSNFGATTKRNDSWP